MNEQLQTSVKKAHREINEFIIDAVCREHRATSTKLVVSAGTYESCWRQIFDVQFKPYRTKVKEAAEGDECDEIKIDYTANNHRYELRIVKSVGVLATAV